MIDWQTPFEEIPIGQGRKLNDGSDVAILTIGHVGNFAQAVIQKMDTYSIAHYDMRFVKPLDESLLHEVFAKHDKIITVEDGCIQGGFGSAVVEFMADHNYQTQVMRLGVPDKYIEHGTQSELWRECEYDQQAIAEQVQQMVGVKKVATTA